MADLLHFVSVDFTRFKAFKRFTLHLREFNVLVGPNNAGKSTILTAFRILATAMRRANARKAELVDGPDGRGSGYRVDLTGISVAEENVFYNYDDSKPATVSFKLSNGNELILFFSEGGHCVLVARAAVKTETPAAFRKEFNCPIGFVPILGPVEDNERLFAKEAARLALFNHTASRNFRNIWHHFPEKFEEFRTTLRATWPGMDVAQPEIDTSGAKPTLFMFCPEDRIPREIFWAGFGFQVWCQMLTHVIQSADKSLFLIDEPDIYLHSDLQRQLLTLLRNLGPDIVIATHSTEIITETEPDDIVLIDKRRNRAKRIKNPSELLNVFRLLGSNLNPILTQLGKTRRAVFVEGKDFQIFGRFAQQLGNSSVSNRSGFAVVPLEGFNPQRIRSLKDGMEATIGGAINAASVLDGDYRCKSERSSIEADCRPHCQFATVLQRKEIENFLLVPDALDRAAERKVKDRAKRSGNPCEYRLDMRQLLEEFADGQKTYVMSQYLADRKRFERSGDPKKHDAQINQVALDEFDKEWADFDNRVAMIPGKDALSFINRKLQEAYSVSVTPTAIIQAMRVDEIPQEMKTLISAIAKFAETRVTN